jgi:flagellin-like protein
MESKGISPLIAAVLLLAFVMAIGGLFSEWSGQLATDSTQQTSDDQGELLDCTGRTIEVDRVETNSNWVNITLRANGGDLGEVTVTLFPEREQKSMDLASNEMINSTSFQVEGQQDRFTAVSTECEAQIEQDIDY